MISLYVGYNYAVYEEFVYYWLIRSNKYWDDRLKTPTIYCYEMSSSDVSLMNLIYIQKLAKQINLKSIIIMTD